MADYPPDFCPCEAYPDCTLRGAAFCYIHAVHETAEQDDYQLCWECGHVYRSEQELVDEYAQAGGRHRLAQDIMFCPACLHDW